MMKVRPGGRLSKRPIGDGAGVVFEDGGDGNFSWASASTLGANSARRSTRALSSRASGVASTRMSGGGITIGAMPAR